MAFVVNLSCQLSPYLRLPVILILSTEQSRSQIVEQTVRILDVWHTMVIQSLPRSRRQASRSFTQPLSYGHQALTTI